MFLGIDLGTSAVKINLVDEHQRVVASADRALHPVQPRPLWSEDDPESWWTAVADGLDQLAAEHPAAMAAVAGIGLSGQMHGALLLDGEDRPVRPAILWNDGRAAAEAAELAGLGEAVQAEMGVLAMPGFAGPKILWLAKHEPETIRRARHLLLPKDFIRLKLCGERATDVTDAGGAWLLDEANRRWSPTALGACGVDPAWLPRLVESREPTGTLRPEIAARWGMGTGVVVAGGAGDATAGGIGIGSVHEGDGFLSLGTSAQIFAAAAAHRPDPGRMVHAFCHAVPGMWCRIAALLNGASPLAAAARWTGNAEIGVLLAEAEARFKGPSRLLALPYLFGERTPHNDPHALGAIVGLTASTHRADLIQAVLEGVAFSLVDGLDTLAASGTRFERLAFIGGGTRSPFWARIIASAMGVALVKYDASDRGPAFGAARLARLAATGEPVADVVVAPPVQSVIEPDPTLHEAYKPRIEAFRSLYRALKPEFARGT
ncbi:xylulokinase [Labrys wisconsinensis]|uniref:Xylulose kinase n=1 Tax=Labrys wisconsinensis TaxID=425677 RepID=A0ABU0JA96_9HYPH|nr:xylulokinase [Labrys wisconsinensis]MDQ0471191.1 xylulokinase [Labrys wisconsinensis]